MNRRRSLFLRLLIGFMSVMFGVWTCLVAAVILEALDRGIEVQGAELEMTAQQALLLMRNYAEKPHELAALAHDFEKIENRRRVNHDGRLALPLSLQVWNRDVLAYGRGGFPMKPPRGEGIRSLEHKGRRWLTFFRTDATRTIAVRVIVEEPKSMLLQPANLGFYLVPLIISFPFLMVPVGFVVRAGLRPVRAMTEAIGQRDAADLKPLEASSYKELAPLVDALNALLERLQERLDREREFLADAAHELKTPLAVIQVNAEALDGSSSASRIAEAQEGLRQGVSRAAHAVHQLLAYARSGGDEAGIPLEQVDLVELTRDRLAALAHIALQRDIELEFTAPETCLLLLHRESAALLIDNLVDNAVKFSPASACVRVCIEAAASEVLLLVEDQGPGIPRQLRKKVFNRFYRMPGETQPGSGLGLSIVERAAEHNNASVVLEDGAHGKGLLAKSIFHLRRVGE